MNVHACVSLCDTCVSLNVSIGAKQLWRLRAQIFPCTTFTLEA
jgi:hypothetical protein